MKNIVSFSSGLSSALTVDRVFQRYGKGATDVVFMDTKIEDDDNYRFLNDCKKRWDIPVAILEEGRNPYQVSKDVSIIPNQKIAPCTFKLKIDVFIKYIKEKYARESVTIHIGYDFKEMHRIPATEKNYQAFGWNVDFPLLWKPYEFRSYSEVVKNDWGITPPRMYELGYTHANCGGRCVKQGMGDWIRTLINFPERYAESEAWEQDMRNHPSRKDYAILRDQSGGKVTALTLRQLREKYLAGKTASLFDMDYQSTCVVCGVGDVAP